MNPPSLGRAARALAVLRRQGIGGSTGGHNRVPDGGRLGGSRESATAWQLSPNAGEKTRPDARDIAPLPTSARPMAGHRAAHILTRLGPRFQSLDSARIPIAGRPNQHRRRLVCLREQRGFAIGWAICRRPAFPGLWFLRLRWWPRRPAAPDRLLFPRGGPCRRNKES